MENLYDSVLYDELPYDDTDSIDYNLKLPGYLYGQHLYGEELYGDPDDYNYAATAAGNTAALQPRVFTSGNTVALKSLNNIKTVSPVRAALKSINNTKTVSSVTIALKSINKTRTITPVTAALKAVNKTNTSTPITVALRSTKSRVVSATVALKSINTRSITATASITFGFVSHQVRAKGNTVALKGYTVLTEITQPVGVLVETQSPETSIIEFNMLGLGAVTSLEATNTFATSITEIGTNFSITSIVEQGVRAHEALYDTQEYDVPMYDETEAVVLSEHVTATCGIEALNAAVATLTERDTWTLSSIVSGITFIDFMYGVMMYGEALYGETRTDIIDTSITGTQSPTAIIGSV